MQQYIFVSGGNLEGTSIVRLFQNADKIFKEFSNDIDKIITTKKQKLKLMKTLIDILEYVLYLILYSPYQEYYAVR